MWDEAQAVLAAFPMGVERFFVHKDEAQCFHHCIGIVESRRRYKQKEDGESSPRIQCLKGFGPGMQVR